MVGGDDVIQRGAVARVEAVERAPDLRLDQPAISSTRERIASSSASNCFDRCSVAPIAVTTLCLMTGHGAMHAGGHETATIRKYAAAMLRRLIGAAGVAAGLIAAPALAADITGAGATFPYPIYAKWADAYKKSTGIGLNYQSIGSGGGIKQITARTVDFGASDMPLKPEELEKGGMIQFPTVIGGDVPVVNLKEIMPGQLRLSGPLLAEIYLGKIRKWNDPAIAALNSGVSLPASDINVVHRSDGSGTTFIWTNYLSKMSPGGSPQWARAPRSIGR